MDDTSEYYMEYEAQMLTSYYQLGDKVKEFHPEFKEYYWGITSLPQQYQLLIADAPPVLNQLNWYQNDTHDIYIYPYSVNQSEFIVVHLFALGDYGDSFEFTSQFLVIATLLLLLLIVAAITWVSRSAVTEITHFQLWLETLKNQKQDKNLVAKDLRFTELQQAADTIISSRNSELALQKQDLERVNREKSFLSTLSHELRTPIAIISAATTLLEKRGALCEKDAKTLAKLTKANGNMKKLTNVLLQLWRRQESNLSKHNIVLHDSVETAIEECKQSIATDISFTISSEDTVLTSIQSSPELVDICLLNILRNACQYSANDKVLIYLNNNKLTVKNTIDDQPYRNFSDSHSIYPDYGFGLGLYLVENICNHQHWHLEVDKTQSKFCVSINFNESAMNNAEK